MLGHTKRVVGTREQDGIRARRARVGSAGGDGRAGSTRSSQCPCGRRRRGSATSARGNRLVRPSSLRRSTGPNAAGVTSRPSRSVACRRQAARRSARCGPGSGSRAGPSSSVTLSAREWGDRARASGRSRRTSACRGTRMSARWTRVPSSRRSEHQHQPKAHQSRTPQEWSRWPCPSTVEGLAADRHGAADGAGDLVAGRDVVVVRARRRWSRSGPPRGARASARLVVDRRRRFGEGDGRAVRRRGGTPRAAAGGRPRPGRPMSDSDDEAVTGWHRGAVVHRADARRRRGARSRPSTRRPGGSGRGRGGASRPTTRRPARSRSSTTRSTGPRRRACGVPRRPAGRRTARLIGPVPGCMAVAPEGPAPRRWLRRGRRTRCAAPSTSPHVGSRAS